MNSASTVTEACRRWERAVMAAGRGDVLDLLDDNGLAESQVRRRLNRAGLRCPADVAAWFGWRNGLRPTVQRRMPLRPFPPSSYLPIPLHEAIVRCDDPLRLGKDVQEATGYSLPPGHLIIAMTWSPQFIVAALSNSPQRRLRVVDFEDPFNDATPLEPVEYYSFVDLMDGMTALIEKYPKRLLKPETYPAPRGWRGWFL